MENSILFLGVLKENGLKGDIFRWCGVESSTCSYFSLQPNRKQAKIRTYNLKTKRLSVTQIGGVEVTTKLKVKVWANYSCDN